MHIDHNGLVLVDRPAELELTRMEQQLEIPLTGGRITEGVVRRPNP
ncbi:hypothetical protein LHJ74_03610 [Streptomyces sp. N2-109]|uniref:Uncharacterized protein n=1 Tax=Streptomyces gossypii TaxID=2883101 RepID=A0ABT2JNT7_9ACTN|nr:hypothetical protein [Streptomyces gossypii]MCT2589030.1 hypothetical protein [Streptomyces gossypii]